MTKFLMTITDVGVPVSINTDMIIAIENTGDGCWVLTSKWNYKLSEPYEQVVKRLTPFVPVEDLSDSTKESKWIAEYLKSIEEVDNANDNNG